MRIKSIGSVILAGLCLSVVSIASANTNPYPNQISFKVNFHYNGGVSPSLLKNAVLKVYGLAELANSHSWVGNQRYILPLEAAFVGNFNNSNHVPKGTYVSETIRGVQLYALSADIFMTSSCLQASVTNKAPDFSEYAINVTLSPVKPPYPPYDGDAIATCQITPVA